MDAEARGPESALVIPYSLPHTQQQSVLGFAAACISYQIKYNIYPYLPSSFTQLLSNHSLKKDKILPTALTKLLKYLIAKSNCPHLNHPHIILIARLVSKDTMFQQPLWGEISEAEQTNSKAGLSLDWSKKRPHKPACEEKKQNFRNACRKTQIENIKKAVRFNWDVEMTLEFLKSIQYKTVESEQILIEAIENQHLEYLVELIVSADPLFKSALLSQCYRLLSLVQARFQQPSSILLLGNLCALYQQFIEASQSKKLLTRLMGLMAEIKANLKCVQICSWALTQMSREPHLLSQAQIVGVLPQLYVVMTEAFAKQSSRQVCTHLCRLVSHFSAVTVFPEDFLHYLSSVYPQRQIDRINMCISIQNQVKISMFSENSHLQIKILGYLLWLHEHVQKKLPQWNESCLYSIVSSLVKKSEPEVAEYVIKQKFSELLLPYKYANRSYYKMFYDLLWKLNVLPVELLEQLRSSGVLQNLVNDISDGNAEVGYLCLRSVEIVAAHALGDGQMEFVEWLLGLELESQVESFLSNVAGNEQMEKHGEKLLDMISVT